MGHYDEFHEADRAAQRYDQMRRIEEVLVDLRSGDRALHVSRDDIGRRSRVARAKELVQNAIDLLRLEVGTLNDGFLKE